MASTSVVVIRPANGTPDTRSSGRPQPYKVVAFPANEMPNMFSRLARKLLCVSAKSVDIDEKPRRHKSGIQAAKNVNFGPDQDFPTLQGYNHNVDIIRQVEYPDLAGRAYLDNAGTQLPPRSLMQAFARDLSSNLYGNPHTHSLPARNSAARVASVRRRALEFFRADHEQYDLVFVANASAAIKLVGEGVRDYCGKSVAEGRSKTFHYVYHKDAHNSLVGLRELAGCSKSICFKDDAEVETWINSRKCEEDDADDTMTLFAYPGQSNMTGCRLPLHWLKAAKSRRDTYTLLDAGALATTKQLDLTAYTPDFTAVSFYKIFGFPDLGALIVRKSAAHLLTGKRYFAGGTVDGVMVFGDEPKMIRRQSIHQILEEGTLPFHSIIALDHAFDVHARLFKSMETESAHVTALTQYCLTHLRTLTHSNGQPLCHIYSLDSLLTHSSELHGGTIAFNLSGADGSRIPYRSVEQAADAARIYVRSGAMCNPGGMATHLGWEKDELKGLFEAGFRCSRPIEVWNGKWTGVVRVSFGAASTKSDVDMLVRFLRKTYLDE